MNTSLRVSGNTNIAYTVLPGASYAGAKSFGLKKGDNTVVLPVKAESGYTTDYTINVKADKDCTLTVGGDTPPKEFMRGDTNGDGMVNGRDLANVQMHILGIKALSGDAFTRADTNSDGKINGRDLANVQNAHFGNQDACLITVFRNIIRTETDYEKNI